MPGRVFIEYDAIHFYLFESFVFSSLIVNICRGCNPLSPNYNKVVQFLNRLDAQAAAAEAAALEAEMRKLDAAKQREKAAEEAELRGDTLKAEKADKCKKKGKSLGQVLFGL